MELKEQFFEVDERLTDVLSYFYCVQTSPEDKTLQQHLSPNFEMMLVFNFGPPVRISFNHESFDGREIRRTAVIGPLRKMLKYKLLPGSEVIVANFTLNGFYRLFQVPMNEINGEDLLNPDTLLDKTCFSELWETLAGIPSLPDRIQLLSNYAASFVRRPESATLPLLDGIPYFHHPFINPVKAIAANNHLSDRTVQLRFQKYLGYSPKELLRFLRFKQVVYHIRQHQGKPTDWFDLISTFGYHDQSHLIKDFNHFLGTTPQQFVRNVSKSEFCVSRPGRHY